MVNGQVTLRTENNAYAASLDKKHQDSNYSGTDIETLLIIANHRISSPLKYSLITSTMFFNVKTLYIIHTMQ